MSNESLATRNSCGFQAGNLLKIKTHPTNTITNIITKTARRTYPFRTDGVGFGIGYGFGFGSEP